jgi:cobalamin biosynthesis protein CobD/CbiB
MTSAWSCWMKRAASPIALEPVAQAVATAVLGPLMWYRIETLPLAALAISRGR